MLRRRRQSVTNVLPVMSSFMRLGSPCGYDVALVFVPVSIDHGYLNTVYKSDCVNADFSIIEAIVLALDRGAIEYSDRICERDRVPANIRNALILVPSEPHVTCL